MTDLDKILKLTSTGSNVRGTKKVYSESELSKIFYELAGPSFSQDEIDKRILKYKVFIGEGDNYAPDTIMISKLIYGTEIPAQIEKEGNLVAKLDKKVEKFNMLKNAHKDSFDKLIKYSSKYLNDLKELDRTYRTITKSVLTSSNPEETKSGKYEFNKKIRGEKIIKIKKELFSQFSEFFKEFNFMNDQADSKNKKSEELMNSYEHMIRYAHFFLQDLLVIGSGNYADIKFDEAWISEHQGLIDWDEWRGVEGKQGSIFYRNLGIGNATVLKFSENTTDKADLEHTISEDHEMELINLDDPRKQKTFLFLSPQGRKLLENKNFSTSPVYVCFEVPKKL